MFRSRTWEKYVSKQQQVRVLTWNVDGLNETRLGQRMEKLCLEMLIGGDLQAAMAGHPMRPAPDVVALQEVVKVAHRGYFEPHFSAAGFTLWPPAPPEGSEYYELLLFGPSWELSDPERRPFTVSPLRRWCTVATAVHRSTGARFTMMTAHLDSLRSGGDARLAQTREIDAWMHAVDGPVVFAGDTNLRASEWKKLEDEVRFRDAFSEAGSPRSARYTWYPEGSERGFRFDRVWVTDEVEIRHIRLRTCQRGSDHHGVETLLALSETPRGRGAATPPVPSR